MTPFPTSLHWLGDRNEARATKHAEDGTGCVLYFASRADCVAFMEWLTAQVKAND